MRKLIIRWLVALTKWLEAGDEERNEYWKQPARAGLTVVAIRRYRELFPGTSLKQAHDMVKGYQAYTKNKAVIDGKD